MILSSEITHGDQVDGGLSRIVVPLKSRWPGDRNPIGGFHYRATETAGNEIWAKEGSFDVGNLDVSVSVFTRPPLAHYTEDGLHIHSGNGYVEVSHIEGSYRAVTLFMRPISSTVQISTDDTVFTFTSGVGGYSASATNSGSVYINGAAWSGNQPFPFNRLVTLVFNVEQTSAIQFGNTWNGTGAVDEMVINRVAFSSNVLSATEISQLAQRVYRKTEPDTVLTDLGQVALGNDLAVPLPESWAVVSSA